MIEGSPVITKVLRSARIQAGLSYKRLAKRIGCDRTTLQRWEALRSIPSLQNATDWANALGCNLILVSKND